jgi:hypothetical protein
MKEDLKLLIAISVEQYAPENLEYKMIKIFHIK